MKPLVIGLEATQRELMAVFERNGITRIAAMGLPLDPNQHQAMIEIPSNEAEPGTVVQEMQAGYMIKDLSLIHISEPTRRTRRSFCRAILGSGSSPEQGWNFVGLLRPPSRSLETPAQC